MSTFRKHLEEKFSCYQRLMSDSMKTRGEEYIDLDSISNDFCCVDGDSRITIEHIPLSGDYVYYTVYKESYGGEFMDIRVDVDDICEKHLEKVVGIMRKAMIIEELRNTVTKCDF